VPQRGLQMSVERRKQNTQWSVDSQNGYIHQRSLSSVI